jgi:hypothetical protein
MVFLQRLYVHFYLWHACHMSHPSFPLWVDCPNSTCCGVNIMKFLLIQFSPSSRYLHRRYKCSSQHHQSEFHTDMKTRQSYVVTYTFSGCTVEEKRFPGFNPTLIYLWMCRVVNAVPKYLNFATFSDTLLTATVLWFCPACWQQDKHKAVPDEPQFALPRFQRLAIFQTARSN